MLRWASHSGASSGSPRRTSRCWCLGSPEAAKRRLPAPSTRSRRDLAKEVEAGRFREDLYYRLHVAIIALPPLRERGRDALLLARHFLDRFAKEFGRGPLRLTPEAQKILIAHRWPGNVRELQNALCQAAALAETAGAVSEELLPPSVRKRSRTA